MGGKLCFGIMPFFDHGRHPLPYGPTFPPHRLITILTLALCVFAKMRAGKRLRVVESTDEEDGDPVDFQQHSGTNRLRKQWRTRNGSGSSPLPQTRVTGLPPAVGLIPPDSSPSARENEIKTRYFFRSHASSGLPYQLQKLQDDDTHSENEDVGSVHSSKRRKLNNETLSSGQKPAEVEEKTGTKVETRLKAPAVVGKSVKTANGLSCHPMLVTLSKFPSVVKPEGYPPPLPRIHDKFLEQQCFTHRSYYTLAMTNYERLEWLGDSFLNYCVAKILYNRLPTIQEGQLTLFRSHLVSNENIYQYAMMYGFPDRLLLSKSAENCRITEKPIADTFEAYIGGLLIDQPETGDRVVFEWIRKIMEPQIDEIAQLRLYNSRAKHQLAGLLAAEKVAAPIYANLQGSKQDRNVEVACLVQGREIVQGSWKEIGKDLWKEIGRGIGNTVKEAQIRAAMQVLEELRVSQPRTRIILVENDQGDFDEVQAEA